MTIACDFKAFLWRHPEIKSFSPMEEMWEHVREICRGRINDKADWITFESVHQSLEALFQRMLTERRLVDYRITPRPDGLKIDVQPGLTAKMIHVDLTINP